MKTAAYAAMSAFSLTKASPGPPLYFISSFFASHKLLPVFLFQSYIYMLSIYDSLGQEEYVETIVLVLVPSEDQHCIYFKYSF